MRNHPNVDEGQNRHPRMPDTPGLDIEEYRRYWHEAAKDNPGKPLLYHEGGQCIILVSRFTVLQKTLEKMRPEQLAQITPEQMAKFLPHVSEKMAKNSDSIRSRLEESRRMNMDEMRELQRWVACMGSCLYHSVLALLHSFKCFVHY